MLIVTLSNGKKVGNFSSPHSFTFEDSTVLPAVSDEEALRLKVNFEELPLNKEGDITLKFTLSDAVMREMLHWTDLYKFKYVDVVFCPLPMITALHDRGYNVLVSPFRTIKRTSRLGNIISISQQCI